MEAAQAVIELRDQSGSEAEDVLRCLRVLYGTRAGEQVLDREFGLDGAFLSRPLAAAQALYTAEVVKKTRRYEPRARVVRVNWTADAPGGAMQPRVLVELV